MKASNKGSKNEMVTAADLDGILDDIGVEKSDAREKAKKYCIGLLQDKEGQCLPANDVRNMAASFYSGYMEAFRMR
jgi:hypothetical protein